MPGHFCYAQSNSDSVAQQDRKLMIRIEDRLETQQREMNAQFEAVDMRFTAMDDKLDELYTSMYFILGGMFGLIGFIFWDSRSYIKPVKADMRDLQSA